MAFHTLFTPKHLVSLVWEMRVPLSNHKGAWNKKPPLWISIRVITFHIWKEPRAVVIVTNQSEAEELTFDWKGFFWMKNGQNIILRCRWLVLGDLGEISLIFHVNCMVMIKILQMLNDKTTLYWLLLLFSCMVHDLLVKSVG